MKILQAVRKHPLLFLSALLPVAVIGFLVLISVYSADDFSYSTFFDEGLAGYIDRMVKHYQEMNGRVIVHVAAHMLFYLGSGAFCLIGMTLTVLVPWFTARSAEFSKRTALFNVGLFAIGITAIPSQVLRQSLLWRSALCNYFLPTALLCGLLALLSRSRGKNPVPIHRYILLIVYACICGATTEQTGLLAVALSLYFAVSAFWHRKKQCLPFAGAALAALIGVWTIFASPATDARLAFETGLNQGFFDLPSLLASFRHITQTLCQTPNFSIFLLIFFTLGGIKLFITLKHRLWALWTAIPSLGSVVLPFIGDQASESYYALLLIAAFALAVQLLFSKAETAGLLALLAIGSMLVMLPTASTGGRVLMPMFLYLIASDILLISTLTEHCRIAVRGGIWAAALGLSLFSLIPLLSGCIHNFKIDQLNKGYVREAKETGILYYCSDYDLDYTHTKPYTADYCLHDYFHSIGLSEEETEIYFYDSQSSAIYVEGTRTMLPAIHNEQGEALYPIRNFYETLGAIVDWDENTDLVTITYKDRVCYVRYLSPTEATVFWTDLNGKEHAVLVERNSSLYYTYLGEAAISEPFGLTVERTDAKTITVRK